MSDKPEKLVMSSAFLHAKSLTDTPEFANRYIDNMVEEQMQGIRYALEDAFIFEMIEKLSAIAKDTAHPAHFVVMRILREVATEQEKNDETDSSK